MLSTPAALAAGPRPPAPAKDRHLRDIMRWHNSHTLFTDLFQTAHHTAIDAGLAGAHMHLMTNYIRPVFNELHELLVQHCGRVAGDIRHRMGRRSDSADVGGCHQAESDLLPILRSTQPVFEVFNQGPVQDPRVRSIRIIYDSLLVVFRSGRLPNQTTTAATSAAAASDDGLQFDQLMRSQAVCPKIATNEVLLAINRLSAKTFGYMSKLDRDQHGNQLTMCSHGVANAAFPLSCIESIRKAKAEGIAINLCRSASSAHDQITDWFSPADGKGENLLPESIANLREGGFHSSHSGRSTGVSGAANSGTAFKEGIKVHGGWKSTPSAELYCNEDYKVQPYGVIRQPFDFLKRNAS